MLTPILLLALCTPGMTSVWKVAPPGEGTHTDIGAAIDDALDGDIILVDASLTLTGRAPSALIDGKGLTIIGDGATRAPMPVTIVENLPSDSEVVFRSLDFLPGPDDTLVGGVLAIRNCDGPVLVEDCTMEGRDAGPVDSEAGGPGMFIGESAGVSIVRSSISGGDGSSTMPGPPPVIFTGHGFRALRVVDSDVTLHGTTVRGGDGGDDANLFTNGGGGGLGLDTLNARLWIVGSTVIGGEGGIGAPPGTSSMGGQLDGFPAGNPSLRELDSVFLGGGSMPGLVVVSGSHTVLPGEAVDFVFPSPVRPGDSASMVITGPPGTLFGLFFSFGAGYLPRNNLNGVFLTDLATLIGPILITLPGSGTLPLPFTVPAAGGGLEGFLGVNQGISSQPGVGFVLSNASTWVQVENGL